MEVVKSAENVLKNELKEFRLRMIESVALVELLAMENKTHRKYAMYAPTINGNVMAVLDGHHQRIVDGIDELEKEYQAVWGAIQMLPRASQRAIMTMRYLGGLTWRDIGQRVGYEHAHLHRIHQAAICAWKWPDQVPRPWAARTQYGPHPISETALEAIRGPVSGCQG